MQFVHRGLEGAGASGTPKRTAGGRLWGNRKMGVWLLLIWPILPTKGWKRGRVFTHHVWVTRSRDLPSSLVSQHAESFLPPVLSPSTTGVPQGHLVHSGGIEGHRLTRDGALVNLCEILSKGEKGLMFKDFLKFENNFKLYSRVERIGLYKEPPYNSLKLFANILSLCFSTVCELSLSLCPSLSLDLNLPSLPTS